MKHPILQGSGYKYYISVWVLVIFAHTLFLHFYFDLPWLISAQDALVFNILFATIALGFWYIVSFVPSNDFLILSLSHLAAIAFITPIWAKIGGSFTSVIIQDEFYSDFVEISTTGRILQGIFYYLVTVLILYIMKNDQKLKLNLKQSHELSNMVKEAELNMLKNQINPHFIFNSLNSISSLTLTDPEKSREMVIKLSDFLRSSLGKDNSETIPLDEELQNLQHYLDIEKVRFGDRLKVELNVREESRAMKVPNMILQPLIENAIKYGIYESLEDVTISITCESKQGSLMINITNNFDPDSIPEKGKGIGLKNIRQRLALLYGSHELLNTSINDHIFKVRLEIPAKSITE